MLDSWNLGVHLIVAITSVTCTVMWTKLRAQSRTIDTLSHNTEYLLKQSAFTSMIMWKLMKNKVTGTVEVENPEHEMEMEEEPCPVEWSYTSSGDPFGVPFGDPCSTPFGDPFGDPFGLTDHIDPIPPPTPSVTSEGSPTSSSMEGGIEVDDVVDFGDEEW